MLIKNINKLFIKGYILEDNYNNEMKKIVEPYLISIEGEGTFIGKNNLEIFYKEFLIPNSKGNIVISHGYSEYIEKYDELIYAFINNGYNVFILEHRGHGRSGNLGSIDETQVSVESFNHYVLDFKRFMDEVVIPKSKNKKIFLFAHSMGGAIATKFLEENNGYFTAAVLSSPMFKINTSPAPYIVAKLISNIATVLGFDNRYIFGQGEYVSKYDMKCAGTNSIARYDYNYYRIDSNKSIQRGGISFRWLKECMKATTYILKKENIKKVSIPILLFQAENDIYVKNEAQNNFKRYSNNCKLEFVKGARHDIYMEVDIVRMGYLQRILEFYNENL